MKTETLPIGQATESQIAEWKKKYKDGIYALIVKGHVAYFRNPTRHDVGTAYEEEGTLAITEKFAELTMIGGSEAVLKEDCLWLNVKGKLWAKVNQNESELVNL